MSTCRKCQRQSGITIDGRCLDCDPLNACEQCDPGTYRQSVKLSEAGKLVRSDVCDSCGDTKEIK